MGRLMMEPKKASRRSFYYSRGTIAVGLGLSHALNHRSMPLESQWIQLHWPHKDRGINTSDCGWPRSKTEHAKTFLAGTPPTVSFLVCSPHWSRHCTRSISASIIFVCPVDHRPVPTLASTRAMSTTGRHFRVSKTSTRRLSAALG